MSGYPYNQFNQASPPPPAQNSYRERGGQGFEEGTGATSGGLITSIIPLWVGYLLLFALAGAAFGMSVYLMVFAKSSGFSGGDQHQWDAIHELQEQVADNIYSSFRLEVTDFEALMDGLPNATIIQYDGLGAYGFIDDPTGLFDFSNPNCTAVTRNCTLQGSLGVYFAADTDESELICMLMPSTTTFPFTGPPMMAGVGSATSTGVFVDPPYVGIVNAAGAFNATAGQCLTVFCSITQGTPFLTFASSHVEMFGK